MSEASYWAVLTAPILKSREISDGAKLFYAQISRFANGSGVCWASNPKLSEELGVSERTITRYVGELESAGFISTEFTGVSDKKRRSERRIRLAQPAPFKVDKNVYLNIDKNGEDKVDKNVHPIKESNLNKNNTPIAPTGGECQSMMLFDRFWRMYPRKVSKEAARRAWKRLAPDILLCSRMSAALKRQMQSEDWQRDDGRYIPYPSTWLNGRRWEDELTPTPQRPPEQPKQEAWGWEA